MRDEMYGRAWTEHHEQFSRDVARALNSLRLAAARLWTWDGSTAQLIALVAAFAITGFSFNTIV